MFCRAVRRFPPEQQRIYKLEKRIRELEKGYRDFKGRVFDITPCSRRCERLCGVL